jgi:hypothetical protein
MFSGFNNRNDSVNSTRLQSTQNQQIDGENVNYVVVFIGLICVILLFLPTDTSTNDDLAPESTHSSIPRYLHLKFELKLFIAYVLGMVTMAILRY